MVHGRTKTDLHRTRLEVTMRPCLLLLLRCYRSWARIVRREEFFRQALVPSHAPRDFSFSRWAPRTSLWRFTCRPRGRGSGDPQGSSLLSPSAPAEPGRRRGSAHDIYCTGQRRAGDLRSPPAWLRGGHALHGLNASKFWVPSGRCGAC